jgi:general secretion pathway protein J
MCNKAIISTPNNRLKKVKLFVQGFTLLELLIALSIFSVIAAMAYGGLGTVLELSAHTQQRAQQWKRIQLTFGRLQQDVEQLIPRSIRNQYGDTETALLVEYDSVAWTRSGWLNPLQQTRSDLQRVRYRYQERAVWRDHWLVLDQAQDSQFHSVLMLDDVEQLKWQFLDANQIWHEHWPPTNHTLPNRNTNAENQSENESVKDSPRLLAITITMTLPHFGELTRLIAVANHE